MILDTPAQIELYSLNVMRSRLKLEIAGMKGRGQTTYSLIKKRFGFKGTRLSVLIQLEYVIDEHKGLNDDEYRGSDYGDD